MRALEEQNHYEVLEISRDIVPEDLERAYRVARDTYSSDSLATYSVFGGSEADAIRERIDRAYEVLSDEKARMQYDATLDPPEVSRESSAPCDESVSDDATSISLALGVSASHGDFDSLDGASESFLELEADVEEEAGDFDGPMLRRLRMRRGFELDQIADITKVSVTNLRNIEEENWADLPATVYVRGFLTAYARTIGLDPQRVVASYVGRLEAAQAETAPGRFRTRR